MTWVLRKLFVVVNTIIIKSVVATSSFSATRRQKVYPNVKIKALPYPLLYSFVHSYFSSTSVILLRKDRNVLLSSALICSISSIDKCCFLLPPTARRESFHSTIDDKIEIMTFQRRTITRSANRMSLFTSHQDADKVPSNDVTKTFDSSENSLPSQRKSTRKRKISSTPENEQVSADVVVEAITMEVTTSSTSDLRRIVTPESFDRFVTKETDSEPVNPRKRSGRKKISQMIPQKLPFEDETSTSADIVTSSRAKSAKEQCVAATNRLDPPKNWESTYSLVEELRSDRTAPCDCDGCEALINSVGTDPKNQRFQALICLMLSSQTKDAVVGYAIRQMQKDGVLNIESIISMDATTLNQYICKVGFHNNKTKYIKEVANILHTTYNDDIPTTAIEMVQALPGVGPKMAYILETVAWKTCSGIGVDTHMHRIFNLLHWCGTTATKDPERTRQRIEQWIPNDKWMDCNLLWVGFGQEVQQFKQKILQKAIQCSRPKEALQLLKQCGLNYIVESKKYGLYDEVQNVLTII